ncbi:hypothetical protein [Microlunatus speluncae]|uniref:hypothetical protein n=1 Tax=Microlunatus speluncae TaxID=2594267 RepID=UPI0012667941|nr:hypothetical protein [Microlunatus speluncae]
MTQHPPTAPLGRETVWLGAGERGHLTRSLLILVPVLLVAAVAMVLVAPHSVTGAVLLGVVVAAVLIVLIFVLRLLPRFLTRQGIRVDESGLEVFAEPRWWFRGWRILLPPAVITAVSRTRRTVQASGTEASDAALAITLTRPVPVGGSPIWCTAVEPGAAPGNGDQVSDDHRLLLDLPAAEVDRLRAAIDRLRTDRSESDVGPGEAWVSLRVGRIVRWGLAALVGLAVTNLPLWSYVASGISTGWPDPFLLVPAGLTVLVLLLVIRSAPAALARQGVGVGPDGIEVRRERCGWQAGLRWRLGWSELRAWSGIFPDPGPLVDLEDQPAERHGAATVLELILNGSPEQPPLPSWARVVPPGVEARRLVADRPRLLIMAGDGDSAERLRWLISRHVRQAEAGESDDAVRMVRWIPVARRGLARMIMAAAVLSFVLVGWFWWGPRPIANPPLWQQAIWPAVPLLAGAGLVWIAGWLVPARLARSGIQVEPAGLQLVRDRFLWSAESRSRLPWQQLGAARVVRVFSIDGLLHGSPVEQAVELELITVADHPLPATTGAHWALPGRDGTGHRLRLLTGDLAAARLIREIGELRPRPTTG